MRPRFDFNRVPIASTPCRIPDLLELLVRADAEDERPPHGIGIDRLANRKHRKHDGDCKRYMPTRIP